MEDTRPAFLTKAVTLAPDVNRRGVMQQAVQHRGGKDIILEYVIIPLSLIVWLVEAIREAVSHLLLSNIPVLRMPLASCSPASLPVFSQVKIVLGSTPSRARAAFNRVGAISPLGRITLFSIEFNRRDRPFLTQMPDHFARNGVTEPCLLISLPGDH